MSEHRILALAGVLIAAAMAQPATAQTDMATSASCDNIEFTSRVLDQLPNAKDYCLEVALRDNKLYAHFASEFVRRSGSDVVLRFKTPDGSLSDPIEITPPENQRINMEGRNVRMRDLNRGDEIDIWLPHDRFEVALHETQDELIAASTVTTYAATIVEEETTAAALPSTASVVPLLGLLGALLATIGGILGWIRIRVGRRST
ncbi:MAG TPA: hypothetical protein VFY03_09120 [Woeseiaceae bacterium]|nr:hypothetical protein [Woeseiaceae bacterium]